MNAKQDTDVIIIGAGHNGLTCAAYLCRAGYSVRVLERREVVGGAAVTEQFHPGFRNSVAAYTVSLLNPKVIADLCLHDHGLEIRQRKVNNLWPQPDGDFLAFPVGSEALRAEIARFSPHDARALERYSADIEIGAALLRDLLLQTPPNAGGGVGELLKMVKLAVRARKLDLHAERVVLDLFTKSVADFLDLYFDDPRVKGAFAFDGIVGFYGTPYTPGTAYVLLHHAFGEVNGKRGVWGHAVGGMGAITQAMAKSASSKGAIIEVDAPVAEVMVEGKRVRGVRLEDGRVFNARVVAANVNPSLLYGHMLDSVELPEDFRRRMAHYKNASGTLRMNVALSGLPKFTCMRQSRASADHLTGGIVIGPTVEYLEQAFLDAREEGWSRAPVVEMLIPSTLDDSLAPPGCHVASLFCQQFSPELQRNGGWDENRERAADTVINTVAEYAPGFHALVLGRQILTPLDLERKFGLVGGDIMHGVLSLDQMFSARPVLGHGNYRGPIKGLYMCGAGTHPGGGVTGAPGHNAAREIISDLKWRRV